MKRITVRLPEDVLQALQAEADRAGCGLSDVVRARLDGPASVPQFQEKKEPRTVPKTVYLSPREEAHISDLAKRRGLGVSAFFRALALGHRLPPALSVFSRIRHELARHGNNLNQLTAAAHEMRRRGGFPSADLVLKTLSDLKDAWVAAGDEMDRAMAAFEERHR